MELSECIPSRTKDNVTQISSLIQGLLPGYIDGLHILQIILHPSFLSTRLLIGVDTASTEFSGKGLGLVSRLSPPNNF